MSTNLAQNYLSRLTVKIPAVSYQEKVLQSRIQTYATPAQQEAIRFSRVASSSTPNRALPSHNASSDTLVIPTNFFCPYCESKSFAKPSDQKRHLLEQHEGRKYFCKNCHRNIKRSYTHVKCKGRKSVFESSRREPAISRGCGFCWASFSDFDKWIRHVQNHQRYEGKQKRDWDYSLELQNQSFGGQVDHGEILAFQPPRTPVRIDKDYSS